MSSWFRQLPFDSVWPDALPLSIQGVFLSYSLTDSRWKEHAIYFSLLAAKQQRRNGTLHSSTNKYIYLPHNCLHCINQ